MAKILPRQTVLVNETLTGRFRRDGYFTMPLLSADACNELTGQLTAERLVQPADFRFSIKSDNVSYKQNILEKLERFFRDILPAISGDYKLARAVYLEKDTGENSFVAMHTDDCCCDETQYVPFHIWIPLVDTTKENGCICVVKGSHLATNTIRGIQVPQHHAVHHRAIFEKFLTPLENKAGEALIYHPALLHYSYPNLGQAVRPAVVAAFIPASAPAVVYYKRNKWLDKRILEYEMSAAQYCFWNEKEEPATRLIRRIKTNEPYDRSPDFLKILEDARR